MIHRPPSNPCLCCGSKGGEFWTRARDIEYLSTADEFDYLHCPDCDSLFIDPVPAERLAEIYPPTYLSFSRGESGLVMRIKMELDRRIFARLLRSIPGEELSVLDVGGAPDSSSM